MVATGLSRALVKLTGFCATGHLATPDYTRTLPVRGSTPRTRPGSRADGPHPGPQVRWTTPQAPAPGRPQIPLEPDSLVTGPTCHGQPIDCEDNQNGEAAIVNTVVNHSQTRTASCCRSRVSCHPTNFGNEGPRCTMDSALESDRQSFDIPRSLGGSELHTWTSQESVRRQTCMHGSRACVP